MPAESSGQNIVLLGGTGMVGGLVLRQALECEDVARVTSIGRRPSGEVHSKLEEVIHEDLGDWSAVTDKLGNQDAAVFCLGVYTGAVPDDELRRLTVDVVASFAEALHDASPRAAFCLLSGAGADQSERSRVAFARYKGMAENSILAMGFSRIHLFRPGYIYPVSSRVEPNAMYRIMRAVYPVIERIYPAAGIRSDALAAAMLDAAINGTQGFESTVLEHRDIHARASRLTAAS